MNIINGYRLNNKMNNYSFKYKNRTNENQITSLGKEIYNLVESVKIGGILVFFKVMNIQKNVILYGQKVKLLRNLNQ